MLTNCNNNFTKASQIFPRKSVYPKNLSSDKKWSSLAAENPIARAVAYFPNPKASKFVEGAFAILSLSEVGSLSVTELGIGALTFFCWSWIGT